MKTAIKMMVLDSPHGHQALYKCNPPLKSWPTDYEVEDYESTRRDVELVVASTSSVLGLETYLFEADEAGHVIDWTELPGSQKMCASHDKVFQDLGYKIIFQGVLE